MTAALDRLAIDHGPQVLGKVVRRDEFKLIGYNINLFLKDKKGALFLVTALEDASIELKSLHRRLGATGRFSFGSADLMRETLGVSPGAVTPFGAINDTACRVTVVLDQDLMAHAVINAHPLLNTMTTSIGRDDLVKVLKATGHPPRIVAVTGPDPGPAADGPAGGRPAPLRPAGPRRSRPHPRRQQHQPRRSRT